MPPYWLLSHLTWGWNSACPNRDSYKGIVLCRIRWPRNSGRNEKNTWWFQAIRKQNWPEAVNQKRPLCYVDICGGTSIQYGLKSCLFACSCFVEDMEHRFKFPVLPRLSPRLPYTCSPADGTTRWDEMEFRTLKAHWMFESITNGGHMDLTFASKIVGVANSRLAGQPGSRW